MLTSPVVMPTRLDPQIAIPLYEAARSAGVGLAAASDEMAGYKWYDELPRVTAIKRFAVTDDVREEIVDMDRQPGARELGRRADRVLNVMTITEADGRGRALAIEREVAIRCSYCLRHDISTELEATLKRGMPVITLRISPVRSHGLIQLTASASGVTTVSKSDWTTPAVRRQAAGDAQTAGSESVFDDAHATKARRPLHVL